MTRRFNQYTNCPECGTPVTLETAFDRWIREHPDLDSSPKRAGLVVFDCDLLIHKYITNVDRVGTREIQALMFVEVKSHGAVLTDAQRDTLFLFNQILRNRRRTPTKKHISPQIGVLPSTLYSTYNKKWIRLMAFGGHWLQMEGDDPEQSAWMRWDDRFTISVPTLVQLLTFELDPDTLRETSNHLWRRHHKAPPRLFPD